MWSNNNLACVYTWLDLNFIKQLDQTFERSGDIAMDKLRYWSRAARPEERRLEALALATQLARMFTGVNFAKYESGKNFGSAVEAMTAVLVDDTNTLTELAVTVDDYYNFFGEIKVE